MLIILLYQKHESYSESTQLNDIAVIKLENMAKINENIQVACLPLNSFFPSNNTLKSWSVGWVKIFTILVWTFRHYSFKILIVIVI